MPESLRVRKKIVRVSTAGACLIVLAVAFVWLRSEFLEAKDRARRQPCAACTGHAGPGFVSYRCRAWGEPQDQVERELRQRLQNLSDFESGLHVPGNSISLWVTIEASRLHGDGLAPLTAEGRNVSALRLENTQLGPGCFEQLGRMQSIKRLYLAKTGTSDDDLRELKSLAHLELLDLRDNPLSADALSELQAALPNCSIKR